MTSRDRRLASCKKKASDEPAPPKNISRYARVLRLATDQSTDEELLQSKLKGVDASLLARIQKMLKLAQHPNTSEAEARQALRASSRMLSAVNLTEAEVMSHESEAEQLQRAGHSVVAVRHRDGKQVSMEAWSETLGSAINVAFNVKFFYTQFGRNIRIEYTFYGLRDNTVAAAVSFEAVFNLALTWAAARTDIKGRTGKNSYLVGLANSLYRMAWKEKTSEEQKAIQAEKKAAEGSEGEAKRFEHIKKQRLATASSGAQDNKAATVEEADDDDDVVFVSFKAGTRDPDSQRQVKLEQDEDVIDLDDDNEPFYEAEDDFDDEEAEDDIGDIDDERRRFDAAFDDEDNIRIHDEDYKDAVKAELDDWVKEEKPDVKPYEQVVAEGDRIYAEAAAARVKEEQGDASAGEAEVPTWQSHAQLVTFKETASRVADDYLKSINTKLSKARTRTRPTTFDRAAYRKGTEDARKVDLKRRRLEGD